MIKSLLDLRNSLVVVARVEDHPDILFTPLMLEEVVLVMAPGYHLAGEGEIPTPNLLVKSSPFYDNPPLLSP